MFNHRHCWGDQSGGLNCTAQKRLMDDFCTAEHWQIFHPLSVCGKQFVKCNGDIQLDYSTLLVCCFSAKLGQEQ